MKTYFAQSVRLVTVLFLTQAVARADVVLDWNIVMQSHGQRSPTLSAGAFAAITQVAVFEAVNAINKEYTPHLGAITAAPGSSAEAAAVAAAHMVLKTYFPANETLDSQRAISLAAIPDGSAKNAGIAVGNMAAAAVLADRNNDGSAPPQFYSPPTQDPGSWAATPSCTAAGGAFFHWRNVKPFVLRSADQFQLDEPPALTSARYTRDYNEVKEMGGTTSALRPQDRADVATYYGAVSPVPVWNPIARQLSVAAGNPLSDNARAFALLNMAMADAAVATFDTKYLYNFWRPETAIRMGHADNNQRTEMDPSFAPFITTPCFPGYPSAHATLSGAAREVLEQLFTPRARSLMLSHPAVPGIALSYRKLKEITDDIDDARVYGGVHFRFEQEGGADLGRRVGEYVYKHSLGSTRACGCEDRQAVVRGNAQ